MPTAPCQVYLDQMRETIATLGRVTPDTLPESTVAGLMSAFRSMHPGRSIDPPG